MVNIEFTYGASTFRMNGQTLVRNFHSYVSGDKIRIVNAYDTQNWLLPYTIYSDISVNGTVYASANELAEVLAPILFLKRGGDETGPTSISGNIITKIVPVQIDWNTNATQQIVDFVNGQAFSVLGVERILFKAVRIIGDIETSNAAEFYYWEFKPGKGTYGTGGTTITSADVEYISFVTNYQNNVINLGEIGTVPIEVYINDAGPFGINSSALNVFKATREGVAVNYIYVGNAISIGLGATQTVSSDYIDVNATPVNPPSSTGGLDVPLEYGLVPVSTPEGTIVWEPKGGSTNEINRINGFVAGYSGGLQYKPWGDWNFGSNNFVAFGDITLDAADANLDRIDLIVLKSDGTIAKKTGTPALNPVEPSIDPATELKAALIIVEAGATAPSGVGLVTIYNENGAEEWSGQANNGGTWNNADTSDPFEGTVALKGTTTFNNGYKLNAPAPVPIADLTEFSFHVKNLTPFFPTRLGVRVYGTGKNGKITQVNATLQGSFDPQNTSSYQKLHVSTEGYSISDITAIEFYHTQYTWGGVPDNETYQFLIDKIIYTNDNAAVGGDLYATIDYSDRKDQEILQAAKDYSDGLEFSATENQYGTHPAFASQNEAIIWLLGNIDSGTAEPQAPTLAVSNISQTGFDYTVS